MKSALCAAIFVLAPAMADAATLSTLADESATLYFWGNDETPTYGQTFTLGTDASLTAISFRMNDVGAAAAFVLSVYGWDTVSGSAPTATLLASGAGSTSGSGEMQTLTVALASGPLAAGKYAFLVEPAPATQGGMIFGAVDADHDYAGGELIYSNDALTMPVEGRTYWVGPWSVAHDLAFAVDYTPVSAVPIGGTLPLALSAFGALGLIRRKRR